MAAPKNPHLYGLVDMGSNGIRFSITDISPPTARVMPTVFQDREGISLYEAQFSHSEGPHSTRGPIPEDIITQVVTRLVRFKITCEDFGVPQENVYVLATEATRTAPNSVEFRARIKDRTGWEVRLLSKEDEGRIGALGIASSSASVAGLAMDLGGGSTQFTWVTEQDGVVQTSSMGSFSFPYGAAALTRRLEQARQEGKQAEQALREEITRRFREAYPRLDVPGELLETTTTTPGGQARFDLYLCGGGFRGWGYVLMKQSPINPYPIPIINGFRARREDFHDTGAVLDVVSASDEKIFGVSKRRASQIPAVAVLVNSIMDALPAITHIQFCQGGVREGFLFDRLPASVRAQDPLLAATQPYAPPSAEAIRDLLLATLPTTPAPIAGTTPPTSFSPALMTALTNLLYAHARVPRETRSAAALHCTTTGILASVNSLSHRQRAILALVLCERWAGDLAPRDQSFQSQLAQCVSAAEAWWCQYVGRVAALVGEVYPAGRVDGAHWRMRVETGWEGLAKKKERCDLLRVRLVRRQRTHASDETATYGEREREEEEEEWLRGVLEERAHRIEKAGKKKNRVRDYGVRVGVSLC